MKTTQFIILILVILFSVARFFMPTRELSLTGTYQAFAHILVGTVFGIWLSSKERFYLILFLCFTGVELVAFLLR